MSEPWQKIIQSGTWLYDGTVPTGVHIVCQNSVYEVTGGQPIPGVERLDFGQMALGAGYRMTGQSERVLLAVI